MPPIAIAGAAVAAGGIVGSYLAGQQQADAIQNAEGAKLSEAKNTRQAALDAATPTTAELTAMSRQVQLQEQALNRQQKLLDAVDPALIEAGQQALKLLRGEGAKVLQPLQQERDRQRNLLVDQINGQMGAGGVNSTAGQEALNRFDAQTAQVLSGAQMDTLGKLLSVSASSRPNPYQGAQENLGYMGSLRSLSNSKVAAINGTPTTPYAGAPFAGAAVEASNLRNMFNGISQLGGTAVGYGVGSAGSMPMTPNPTAGNVGGFSNYQGDFDPSYAAKV